jgi:hypothetical protein
MTSTSILKSDLYAIVLIKIRPLKYLNQYVRTPYSWYPHFQPSRAMISGQQPFWRRNAKIHARFGAESKLFGGIHV